MATTPTAASVPPISCNRAPIALFVYNRPWHTRQTIDALRRNQLASDSDLIVFSDAARDAAAVPAVREVRELVESASGFKSLRIVARASNLGLAGSIIGGVTAVCAEYGRVIVIEDDLVTAPSFLSYMNQSLSIYENDEVVGSIHGYWYPVDTRVPETFFLRGASCWGWATWLRAWQLFEPDGRKLLAELKRRKLVNSFDLDGAVPYTQMLKNQLTEKVDSWAIRWHAAMFLANRLQLWPGRSLVRNVGFDGTGTNCGESAAYNVEPSEIPVATSRIPLVESAEARAALIHYHRSTRRSIPARAISRLRRMVGI
jgi:Glycosyl transferase family 2